MGDPGSWPLTRSTLLLKIRDAGDLDAWASFVDLYGALIYRYCRRRGLQSDDAADVTQDVLIQVWRSMPGFDYQPVRGRFRAWLGTVTRNRLARRWSKVSRERAHAIDDNDAPATAPDSLWEEESRRQLLATALDRIRPKFESQTWELFKQTWRHSRDAAEIARECDVPIDRVYVARHRVLKALEAAVRQLSDDEPWAN